jgi:hypothetical protein
MSSQNRVAELSIVVAEAFKTAALVSAPSSFPPAQHQALDRTDRPLRATYRVNQSITDSVSSFVSLPTNRSCHPSQKSEKTLQTNIVVPAGNPTVKPHGNTTGHVTRHYVPAFLDCQAVSTLNSEFFTGT